jgi:hypothetical protein
LSHVHALTLAHQVYNNNNKKTTTATTDTAVNAIIDKRFTAWHTVNFVICF